MKCKAFTLIEISVVLVVVGLLVGGIIAGRELINDAAMRAQISQIQQYQQALNTFKGKYGYQPGDIPDPTASEFGFSVRGAYAGEGDGNGLIEAITANAASSNSTGARVSGEQTMFWKDLADAKLIAGGFISTATAVAASPISQTGISGYFPRAKISSESSVYISTGGPTTTDTQHYFCVSQVATCGPSCLSAAKVVSTITVGQAQSIDSKIDDGLPQFGNILAFAGHGVSGWAVGGGLSTTVGGIPYNYNFGAYHSGTFGPVVNGDTVSTTLQTYTCYDNAATVGSIEHYSVPANYAAPNCRIASKFQ